MRHYRSKKEAWRISTTAVREIDKYWGRAIGSFEIRYHTIEVENRDCDPDIVDGWYDDCEWDNETVTYKIYIPTKNDGLLPPHVMLWNKESKYDDSHNIF